MRQNAGASSLVGCPYLFYDSLRVGLPLMIWGLRGVLSDEYFSIYNTPHNCIRTIRILAESSVHNRQVLLTVKAGPKHEQPKY